MPDPGTAVAIAGIAGALFGSSRGDDGPDPVTPPDQVNQEAIAAESRRRALAKSGRPGTLLTDDTETPAAQQIPTNQIGRATLLGS